MTSHLTRLTDSPSDTRADRGSDRIHAKPTKKARAKTGKPPRSDHKVARTTARPAAGTGATMTYQQGFTSGPGL